MRGLNEAFNKSKKYATVIVLSFHRVTGRLAFSNAGHLPPLWYHAAQRSWGWLEEGSDPQLKRVAGLPVGLIPGTDYSQTVVTLKLSDLLVLYTDGITEAEKRPSNIFQSATVHLNTTEAFEQFKDAITADRRLNLDVTREIDYHSAQSGRTSHLITILGGHIASVMAIGAIFGALNTMYSAVTERGREIATMRTLGFGGGSVIFSFLIEALLISLLGGIVGCLAVLPLNGLTTGAMNWQTFTHLAFAFSITPSLLTAGVIFALIMGLLGGLPPAIRAALQPVACALREL